jgi:hypothetical protein
MERSQIRRIMGTCTSLRNGCLLKIPHLQLQRREHIWQNSFDHLKNLATENREQQGTQLVLTGMLTDEAVLHVTV